jgi:paraquat-inducible protein B
MAESTDRDDLPQATVVPKKRRRISVIWMIPILAAAVAFGIAVQRILSEGPTVTIVFKNAQGVEAGKTFVKYNDVNIGQVTVVQLSEDYTRVTVTAKIAKSAAGLMVDDSKFWIVEPRISLSGVSGLSTLLSGNYIGLEAGKSDKSRRNFVGLEVPPPVPGGQRGRQFILNSSKLGSLGIGAPVYYHSLPAGQVIEYKLASDGKAVVIKIFVNEPYDRYVTHETRFWNASGVDVTVGGSGVEVRTESLAALIAGGLAFDAPSFAPAAEPAAADTAFTLYGDQVTAMKQPESIALRYVLYFKESLRGLSVGAPVTLLGLPGGEVIAVGLDLDRAKMTLRGRVEIVTYPERLVAQLHAQQAAAGAALARNTQQRHVFFQKLVEERGLRAQLRSGNLLTGQLFVALDFFPNAPKARIDWSHDPVELPVVPSTVPDIEAKISSILAKLDKLQYEEIGADTRKVLASFNQVLKDTDKAVIHIDSDVTPELKPVLEDFRRATVSADKLIQNTDATLVGKDAPGQQELRDAMQEIARAARSLRVLTDYLERHPDALIRGKTEEKP